MDTDRENTPSNKTQSFTESMNMSIWEVSTLIQLFKRDSYVEITFSKKKIIGKTQNVLCGESALYSTFYWT